jgi:hypothetical protein
MRLFRIIGSFATLACLASGVVWAAQSEKVDASDPTKIYSYAGLGYKFTEYDNGDSLNEVRAIGNIGFSDSDMPLFEIGYGNYSATVLSSEKDSGATNGRSLFPSNRNGLQHCEELSGLGNAG